VSAELEVIDAIRMATLETVMEGVPIGDDLIVVEDERCCILATRIALEALEQRLIFGRALKVHVGIYNRWGWEWQQANPDRHLLNELGAVELLAQEAGDHSVEFCERAAQERGLPPKGRYRFCGHGTELPESFSLSSPGWLNGHAVALLRVGNEHVLLDVTAPQFTTPQFKLFIEPLMFVVADEWARNPGESWLLGEPECLNGGAIVYRQPNDLAGVYDAPDWKNHTPEQIKVLAEGVLRRADERLALMRL
jgi:hypothetical protein